MSDSNMKTASQINSGVVGHYAFEPAVEKIREQIKSLERTINQGTESEFSAMTDLCGRIIATLKVNRDRNTINSADNDQFDKLIESWQKEYRAIGTKGKRIADSTTDYKNNPPVDDL